MKILTFGNSVQSVFWGSIEIFYYGVFNKNVYLSDL